MYLVRSRSYSTQERSSIRKTNIEVLAETEQDVIKVIETFGKEELILEEVVTVPNYQTAKEYLKEKPEDLVCGKKGGNDDKK